MADSNTDATTLARWAAAHGFAPSERELKGETPLLRQGLVDVATDVHEGELDGRPARIFSPLRRRARVSRCSATRARRRPPFTVLLVAVDAPAWPRVTIHPAEFPEDNWLTRVLRHDDHRVRDLGPAFDERFRLRVAHSTPKDAVDRPGVVGARSRGASASRT